MIKKILLNLICVLFVLNLHKTKAQNWQLQGITGSGLTSSTAIFKDEADNTYITGNFTDTIFIGNLTFTTGGDYDVFVVSYKPNGTLNWAKSFGGNSSDYTYDAVYSNGNIYFGGAFYSNSINFITDTIYNSGGITGNTESYIACIDTSGNFIWARSFGSPNAFNDQLNDIEVHDNALYIAGNFEGSFEAGNGVVGGSSGLTDAYFLKLGINGDTKWAQFAHGSKSDFGNAIACDDFGNVYMAGTFGNSSGLGSFSVFIGSYQFTASGTVGFSDVFLAKFDTAGVFQYAIRDGGNNPDIARKILIDDNKVLLSGIYYYTTNLSGDVYTTNGGYEGFISTYDTTLSHQWSQVFTNSQGPTNTDESVLGLSKDNSGSYYIFIQHSPIKYSLYYLNNSGNILSNDDLFTQCNSSSSGALFIDSNCGSAYLTASFIDLVSTVSDTLSGNYDDVFWGIRNDSTVFMNAPGGITSSVPDSICANEANFNVTVNAVANAQNYSWQIVPHQAGMIIGNGTQAIVNIDSTFYGPVMVYCFASNGCSVSEASDTIRFFVKAVPSAPVITLNGLQLNTTSPAQLYNWYNNGTLVANTTVNYYGSTVNGYYTLTTSNNGCTSEASNGILITTVSVSNISQNEVFFYLNEEGNLVIQSKEDFKNSPYQLLDLNGRIMAEGKIKSSSEIVQLTNYSNALFILRIWKESGENLCFKVAGLNR